MEAEDKEEKIVEEKVDRSFKILLEVDVKSKDAEEICNKICKLENTSRVLGFDNYKLKSLNKNK